MPTSRSYQAYLIESLKNPQEAAAYLDAVLEDGNPEEIRLALRNVATAQSASLSDAEIASNPKNTHQDMSQQNHLDVDFLLRMLDNLGFKLSVTPKET
ncbi:MAG TPA: transcriptional regulator [Crinalium sp.]|jgi:DNA-binding phage protein